MAEEYRHALETFLPSYLLRQAATGTSLERWEARFPAAVLVADISGFTPLAEALSCAGRRGAEELSSLLEARFSRMIGLVHDYGGDVAQFSGDAVTALFALSSGEDLAAAVRRAAACGWAIQGDIAASKVLRTSQGEFPLQVRIGIGAGATLVAVVGNPTSGLRHLLAGPARQDAVRALGLGRPGQVVLSRAALQAADRVAAIPTRWGYARLSSCQEPALPVPQAAESRSDIRTETLAAFLPPALGQRIQAGGRAFLGEHRYVVVLFVGFRGLDFALDLAVVERMRAYVAAMQAVIDRYAGYLAEIEVSDKGSLLLVLFGAPSAHEDDEARAVLCAMEMQERVRQTDLTFVAGQRAGISAGSLFVGAVGGPARWSYTAVGDEVNLAARLMERAAWGQVVASSRVCQGAGARGRFAPLGRVALKGKAEPVPAFVVLGVRERPAILAERMSLYQGEIVGRQAEMARMRAAAERAAQGQVQVLLIEGEAGLGKSRLVAELAHWWFEQGYRGYSGDCLSYTQGQPYRPWSELLEAALGLTPDRPAAERLRQAEDVLREIGPGWVDRLPLLADVLGLPAAETAVTKGLQGAERRRALFRLVLEIVRHLSERGPLLLLWEDIHWSDTPSLELIEHLAHHLAGRPVLMVLLHRPLEEPLPAPYRRLAGHPGCEHVVLEALPDESCQALARARLGLAPGVHLPAPIEGLLARAQGNPFFLEEILNTLHDAGVRLEVRDGDCVVVGDPAAVEFPPTVQALIQARLDRLEEDVQLTVKVAAVVGRTVPYSILQAIHPQRPDGRTLDAHLSALQRVDLLRLERLAAEPTFFFKHVITQQVAYESLLFAQRQALHEALGRHLEEVHARNLDEAVDLLAHHFGLSRNREKAYAYLVRAGDRASRTHTHREALEYYRRAQAWLEEGNRLQHWDLLQRLERAYNAVGWRDEQRRTLEEMAELASHLGDKQRQATVLARRGTLLSQTGHPEEGIRLLRQAVALAEQSGDFSMAGWCAIDISRAFWLLCKEDESQHALDQARRLFQRGGDRQGEAAVFNMLGNICLAILSQYERALHCFREEGRLAQETGDEYGQAASRVNQAIALIILGQAQEALALTAPAQAFFERAGNPRLLGVAFFAAGHALLRLERFEEALVTARRCLGLMEECEEHNFLIESEGLVGRILLALDRPTEAHDHFRRACELAQAGGQEVDWAHYRSYEALLLLRLGRPEEALALSEEVVAVLERQPQRVDNLQTMLWHHFLIVRQVRGPHAAQPFLEKAYSVVQEVASEIRDPLLRRSFLERDPLNREICALVQPH